MTKHFDRDQQVFSFNNIDNRKIQNNKQNFDKQKNRTKKRFDYNQSNYYSQYRFDYYYLSKSFNSIYQYQNKSSNDDRQQSQSRLLFAKLFLQIIHENALNSRTDQRNTRSINRFSENIFRNNVNINRENDYNRSRKTYVIDEQNEKLIEKKIEKNFFNDDQNSSKNETFYFEKLNYYNSNYSRQKKEKSSTTNFVTVTFIICRRCEFIFLSNNRLHNHLRVDCRQSSFLRKIVTNTSSIVYSIEITFFIEIIKVNFTSFDKIFVINFDVNASKDIEIEYEFRD